MRFALIGDSQGQGTFPTLSRLLKEAGHTVVLNRAEPGKDPRWWTQQPLADQLRTAAPDAVVFQLSGNNGERKPEVYQGYVEAILKTVPAGARVWWLSPALATRADIEARHKQTWELERAILPTLGVTWIDMRPWTTSGHRDGVHFHSATYASIGQKLAQAILKPAPAPQDTRLVPKLPEASQPPFQRWGFALLIPSLFLLWRWLRGRQNVKEG